MAVDTDDKVRSEGVCLDVEFYLDNRWRFCVPDLDRTFNSYEDMKDAIERNYKTVESSKRRKVNIPAVNEKGKKITVTGVHAGHGKLITTPKADSSRWNRVYVDHPIVTQAFAEKRRLESDVSRIAGLLDKFKLNDTSYRTFDPSMHEGEIKRLEKIQSDAEKFNGKTLAEALVGIKPSDEYEF